MLTDNKGQQEASLIIMCTGFQLEALPRQLHV